ncbi:C1 family peptidase [Solihabitans fulvus]|uniref:C1 family peptidase n=1 Tax=Solihabitans fulvus TaxID=1892852 RepID=A0A5B2WKZ0_9PSEU|nr:C1 family peptidase [Solihabitans fulvus]KAA2252693.1 C1 family peptidase [Solihabitans fulvus]
MASTPRSIARYGWVRDLPDARDHLYSAPRIALVSLPPSVDLRSGQAAVYDQGQIGSCTANAIGAAVEYDLMKQSQDFMPSRLFIYYNERAMEGNIASDSGAQIRDGVKSVAQLGVCPETEWPYDATPAQPDGTFPPSSKAKDKPTQQCYADALKAKVTSYQRVAQTLDECRGCLAAGYPFVFGFTVYSSFESAEVAKTGVVPMPNAQTEQVLGGHAVLAVGYDDATQRFTVRNSWGTGWGQAGYFTMPYAYLTEASLSSDFWTVRAVL